MKDNFQLWRFATFPLAYISNANAFLGFFALFFFAPKLRNQLNSGVLDFSIILHTFAIGLILFMLNMNSPQTTVMGIEAISAYIITMYVLVNRKNDIRYFKTVRLTRMAFPLFILAGWAMLYLVENGNVHFNKNLIEQSPAILGIGIITGLIGYFMLKEEKVDLSHLHESPSFGVREFRDLEPSPALIDSYTKSEQLSSTKKKNNYIFSEEDPESNEEILNDILEHINESGYDSLQEEERAFLKKYAKSI
jgi:membrane-bound ClpP family serine protease